MIKRHQISWLPGDHQGDHNDCDCDLLVSYPSTTIPQMTILRKQGRRRTVREMYAEAQAPIVSNYYLSRDDKDLVVVKNMPFNSEQYLQYMRQYHTSESQIAIEPPYIERSEMKQLEVPRIDTWEKLHADVEQRYWNRVFPQFSSVKPGEDTLQGLIRKKKCHGTQLSMTHGLVVKE